MDDGQGHFQRLDKGKLADLQKEVAKLEIKHPNHGGWFMVGEEIEIRGSCFRVKSIKSDELRLKLLKKVK